MVAVEHNLGPLGWVFERESNLLSSHTHHGGDPPNPFSSATT